MHRRCFQVHGPDHVVRLQLDHRHHPPQPLDRGHECKHVKRPGENDVNYFPFVTPLGSLSPSCLRTAFTTADPKVQKDADDLTVFLLFLDLQM